MRKIIETQKRNKLKSLMNSLKPFKLNFGQLPTITENQGRVQNSNIREHQTSPKIFINSQEALIWIKKDFDQRTKHDLLEKIKKKAEQQLSIQGETYEKRSEENRKRNYSLSFRKYSSSLRSRNNVLKKQQCEFSKDEGQQNKQNKRNKYLNPFLNIQVLQANSEKKKSSASIRIRTERMKNQSINNQGLQKNTELKTERDRIKTQMKSKCKKYRTIQEQLSFKPEFLSPW